MLKYFCCTIVVHLLILVVFIGIAKQYCTLQVPPIAGFIIMFFCLILIAYMEGLHYGCVQISKWDPSLLEKYPRALKCWHLVNTTGKVKKFLVGRQFFLIFAVFLLAGFVRCFQFTVSLVLLVLLTSSLNFNDCFISDRGHELPSYSERLRQHACNDGNCIGANRSARSCDYTDLRPADFSVVCRTGQILTLATTVLDAQYLLLRFLLLTATHYFLYLYTVHCSFHEHVRMRVLYQAFTFCGMAGCMSLFSFAFPYHE